MHHSRAGILLTMQIRDISLKAILVGSLVILVAQGGDTIGDREGASPFTIREEINYRKHSPMTVGMATSGKDTGSSQFFINTARNPHLDRNYTIFGKVIEGHDIVMAMSNGVQIIEVNID